MATQMVKNQVFEKGPYRAVVVGKVADVFQVNSFTTPPNCLTQHLGTVWINDGRWEVSHSEGCGYIPINWVLRLLRHAL